MITLLSDLSTDDRTIIVSGLLPRGSVDLEPYNDRLRTLCSENDIAFIDNFNRFLLASGNSSKCVRNKKTPSKH